MKSKRKVKAREFVVEVIRENMSLSDLEEFLPLTVETLYDLIGYMLMRVDDTLPGENVHWTLKKMVQWDEIQIVKDEVDENYDVLDLDDLTDRLIKYRKRGSKKQDF